MADALSRSELSCSNQNNEATRTMTNLLEGNILALANKRSKNHMSIERVKIGKEVNKHLGVSKLDQATPCSIRARLNLHSNCVRRGVPRQGRQPNQRICRVNGTQGRVLRI
ncbi:hypothetical protein TW85_23920 [Marinomonas sp. S3726]|uniref:hypothetical protein n=1 Tax=Marinomonas sp. S3726 TaxID=579484 RepID=UPI0005FA2D59|nr:hypothetical protein [Marinomonas sp. S3726]KJZ08161.1 hypothetical protein TW85_23920 [Marinomonas sp. S3726]